MSEEESARLRAQAEQCRRLARHTNDRTAIDALQLTARELEAEAERLEPQPPQPRMTPEG